MHSWFPMYFPIKTPFIAYKGQRVTISIWRNHNASAVWYEWAMSLEQKVPGVKGGGSDQNDYQMISKTFIHNAKGRGYSIGL